MDKGTGRIYSGGKLYLDEFFSSYTFGDTIFHSFPPKVRNMSKPKEMKDILDFFLETVANNEVEEPLKEEVTVNATYDDIINALDTIMFQLDVIEFLIIILADAASEYSESCDIPDKAILKWLCDQILNATQEIEDQYTYVEANPVGRINIMYGWFKPYMNNHINLYLRQLGAESYKNSLDITECGTGMRGLNGSVLWMRKYGHGQLKYYTERLKLFAYREKQRNTP